MCLPYSNFLLSAYIRYLVNKLFFTDTHGFDIIYKRNLICIGMVLFPHVIHTLEIKQEQLTCGRNLKIYVTVNENHSIEQYLMKNKPSKNVFKDFLNL